VSFRKQIANNNSNEISCCPEFIGIVNEITSSQTLLVSSRNAEVVKSYFTDSDTNDKSTMQELPAQEDRGQIVRSRANIEQINSAKLQHLYDGTWQSLVTV